MPAFTVTATTGEGRRVSKSLNAPDSQSAVNAVRAQGFYPTKVSLARFAGWQNRRIRATPRELIALFEQLELQLAEGVRTEDAIAALKDEFPSARIRELLAGVERTLTTSKGNLHQAFAEYPATFGPDVLAIIEAGQSGGAEELGARFGDLRNRIEFVTAIRQTIFRAAAYPAFVFLLVGFLIIFVMGNVFPKMVDLLYSLGATLPELTLNLIALSKFFEHNFVVLLALLIVIPGGAYLARRISSIAFYTDHLFLRLPLIGDIYRSLITALVAKNYRSLYLIHMSPPDALDLCGRMIKNRAVQAALRRVKSDVLAGHSLGVAFKRVGYFPAIAAMTIQTGETTGRLETALDRVATFFEKEAQRKITTAVGLLQPVFILIAVGLVGTVLMSFFLPLISVMNAIR